MKIGELNACVRILNSRWAKLTEQAPSGIAAPSNKKVRPEVGFRSRNLGGNCGVEARLTYPQPDVNQVILVSNLRRQA
jgi:hypothetical protein